MQAAFAKNRSFYNGLDGLVWYCVTYVTWKEVVGEVKGRMGMSYRDAAARSVGRSGVQASEPAFSTDSDQRRVGALANIWDWLQKCVERNPTRVASPKLVLTTPCRSEIAQLSVVWRSSLGLVGLLLPTEKWEAMCSRASALGSVPARPEPHTSAEIQRRHEALRRQECVKVRGISDDCVSSPTYERSESAHRYRCSGNRIQNGHSQSDMHTSRNSCRSNEFILPGTAGGNDTEFRPGNANGWGGRRLNEPFGVDEEASMQPIFSGRSLTRGVDCYSSGCRKSQWRGGKQDVQEWTYPRFYRYPCHFNGHGREIRYKDFEIRDASDGEATDSQKGSRGREWFQPKEDCRQQSVEADRFSSSTKSTRGLGGEVRNRMVSIERRKQSSVSAYMRRCDGHQQEWDHNSVKSRGSEMQAWKVSSVDSETLDGTAVSRECNCSGRPAVESYAVVRALQNRHDEGELANRRMKQNVVDAGIGSTNIIIRGATNIRNLKTDGIGVSVQNEASERERERCDCSATWLLEKKYNSGSYGAVIGNLDATIAGIDRQKGQGGRHHVTGHLKLQNSHSDQSLNTFGEGDEETCRHANSDIVSQHIKLPNQGEASRQEQQIALGGEKLTMVKRLDSGNEGRGIMAMGQDSSARRIDQTATLLSPVALPSSVSKEVEASLQSACDHGPVGRQLTDSPQDESRGKCCAMLSSQSQLNGGSPVPAITSVHRRNIEMPKPSNCASHEIDLCTLSTNSAESKPLKRLDENEEENKGTLTGSVMADHLGNQSATAVSWDESKSYTAAGTVAIPAMRFFDGAQQCRGGCSRAGRSLSVREPLAGDCDRGANLLKRRLATGNSKEPDVANSASWANERTLQDYANDVDYSQSNKEKRSAFPPTINSRKQHLERIVLSPRTLSAESACDVSVEQVHSGGDGRMVLPVANVFGSSKMMTSSVAEVSLQDSSTQSPEKPTFHAEEACQTPSAGSPPFILSSFHSSTNSLKGNKRIRSILNDCRLLENLPKVIRSENSSPKLWSGSESGERSIDSGQKLSESVISELSKTHSPIFARLSSYRIPVVDTAHYKVAQQPRIPASDVLSSSCTKCGRNEMRSSNEEEHLNEGGRLLPCRHLTSQRQFDTKEFQRDESTHSACSESLSVVPCLKEEHTNTMNGGENSAPSKTLPSHDRNTAQTSSAAALLPTSYDSQSNSLSSSIVHTVFPRSRNGSAQGKGEGAVLNSFENLGVQLNGLGAWRCFGSLPEDLCFGRGTHLKDAKVKCQDQCPPNELSPSVVTLAEYVSRSLVVTSVVSAPSSKPPGGRSTLPSSAGVRFQVSMMDVLSEEIWHLHTTRMQSEITLGRKLHLRDMLYCRVSQIFPSTFEMIACRDGICESGQLGSFKVFVAVCGLYMVGSSLNGFGSNSSDMDLCLMISHREVSRYLQSPRGMSPPLLPSLQKLYPSRFDHRSDVCKLDMSVPLHPPPEEVWPFSETSTLSELLIGFLEYYAIKFDYSRDAISVRLGKKVDRAVVARQRSQFNNMAQWNYICIEEPFTLSNTAHSIHSQMAFDAIKEALIDGYKELYVNRDLHAFLSAPPIHIPAPFGSSAHLSELSRDNPDRVQEKADGAEDRSIQQVSFTPETYITHPATITPTDAAPSTGSVTRNSQRDEKNFASRTSDEDVPEVSQRITLSQNVEHDTALLTLTNDR
ncbi:unnamed protein product [Toxocara canis]|uniref:PAP-associated domain-containing protein n=1 Tax=Toxocara canis TaxID=6265 RepID=A0A183UE82_TOXCA|nr:unnamed protein product [Toxocara canis]